MGAHRKNLSQFSLENSARLFINNYILGFPAGISDSKDIAKEALRELKEETGYTGEVTGESPIIKVNPGLINDCCIIINAQIDENDPRNKSPKQFLEPSEEIKVILKKKEEIKEFLMQEKARGCEIAAGIWYVFGTL